MSNPFPADRNPLIPPRRREFGAAYGTGGTSVLWFNQVQRRPTNDRFSLSIQRQLPGQIVFDVTGFMNFGHNVFNTRNQTNVSSALTPTSMMSRPPPIGRHSRRVVNHGTASAPQVVTSYPAAESGCQFKVVADTSVFKIQTPFTPRLNPWQYGGLTGPGIWELPARQLLRPAA